ncbi:MAG: hypothetical protein PHH01_01725 [Patescibacteria group bacterium]|nr:hypothetical protein [Patescibacteria group bacterium]
MWFQEKKGLIDRRLAGVIVGGFFIIVAIVILTLVLEKPFFFKSRARFDRLVPADARLYLHLDLSSQPRRQLKDLEDNEGWNTFMVNAEKELKRIFSSSFDLDRLSSEFGNEIALVRLTGEKTGLLAKVRSADRFEKLLVEMFGAGTTETVKGTAITKQAIASDKFLYWTNLPGDIFVIANSSDLIQAVSSVEKKERASIEDKIKPYRRGSHLVTGIVCLTDYFSADKENDTAANLILRNSTELSELYFELDIAQGTFMGTMSNHVPTLLEEVSAGEAEDIYRESIRYLPGTGALSWLKVNPKDFLETLVQEQGDESDQTTFDRVRFLKEEIGFDWQKDILPLLNVATDVTLGQSGQPDGSTAPFLFSIEPGDDSGALNNFEALVKRVIGLRFPRKVEKTLTDGSKVTELLPDPQAGQTEPLQIDYQKIDSLQLFSLPDSTQLIFGLWQSRIIFSNSFELVKSIVQKPETETNQTPTCIENLKGRRLIILDQKYLESISPLGHNIKKVYIGDGSKDERVYLNYCIEF